MKILGIQNIFCLALIGLISFFIVTALWPMNSFYVSEFETNSNVSLGKTFKVLVKKSSYPDFHGDYYSKAVFKIKNLDLSELAEDLEEIDECNIPNLVKPYLDRDNSSPKCWEVNRDFDERFNVTYFEKANLLYYEFNQT